LKYLKQGLIVVHPLLFAMFFVLALYSANVAEVSPSEIVIPLVAVLGFALLLLLLALLLIGLIRKLQKPHKSAQPYQMWDFTKAALVASIFIVLNFTFGHALIASGGWDELTRSIGDPIYWLLLSIIWIALLTIGVYFVIKTRRDLSKLTIILSVVAATLVIIPAVNIITNETKATPQDTNVSENIVDLVQPDTSPDIYYIILDRYSSARTLKEVYDFDNSEFIDYLSDKGFYVANESRANYSNSPKSIASSLNMDFIHEETSELWIGKHSSNKLIRDYKVWHLLKSVGYEFVHFGSWWETTRENPYADINVNYYAMPEFSWFLFQTTWLYPISVSMNIVDGFDEVQYKRVLYKFDKMAEIPQREGPTYVFAHMLVPHPPFIFDREGNFVSQDSASEKDLTTLRQDQMIATNNMLRNLIDELLSSSEVPPIIILQADEGSRPERYLLNPPLFDWGEATEAEWREKYGILNAYYLPNVNHDVLYPSITPVNSFRLIFNLYFGADFELLPDDSYFSDRYRSPFDFSDVTDKATYD
jgi:hypothetical protein